MSTTEFQLQCPVCAWRQDCKKKHTIASQGGKLRCPEFSPDLTLTKDRSEKDEEARR